MTKAEYLNRPDDIDLGPIWNAMRLRQRELSWPGAWAQSMQANCLMGQYQNSDGYSYANQQQGSMQALGGLMNAGALGFGAFGG